MDLFSQSRINIYRCPNLVIGFLILSIDLCHWIIAWRIWRHFPRENRTGRFSTKQSPFTQNQVCICMFIVIEMSVKIDKLYWALVYTVQSRQHRASHLLELIPVIPARTSIRLELIAVSLAMLIALIYLDKYVEPLSNLNLHVVFPCLAYYINLISITWISLSNLNW